MNLDLNNRNNLLNGYQDINKKIDDQFSILMNRWIKNYFYDDESNNYGLRDVDGSL